MSYFNNDVKATLAAAGVVLSPEELQTYAAICDQAKKLTFECKTKKAPDKGLRFSLWHVHESDTNSSMTHWLVLPGLKSWKSKGKEVATKLVVNVVTGQKMFLKIRRPNSIVQKDHIAGSRQEATNNKLMNSTAQHFTRYSPGHGTKAYLFQKYRGDLCLQNIIDDPLSPSKKIVNILMASGDALNAMNARGYLHTDFKPRNVVFNHSNRTLALVDLEFMLSVKAGAAGVNQFAGTAPFQHADWRKESIRNFHSGVGVKYTPKNDLYAFLVTADTCLGTAYSHADADYRKILTPAWVQIRQWKDLPYAALPTLPEVLNTLNQLLSANNINVIQAQPREHYQTRQPHKM